MWINDPHRIQWRLRGTRIEEDEDGDTVVDANSLRKTIYDITSRANKKAGKGDQGVDILADDENFKSTYQILLEISRVWKDINDKERAGLLEKIAGKHRASVVAALLDDTEGLEKAYKMALESQGSAMAEFEKRTESIEYHLGQLKASWQELASNTATADFVNMFIDAARAIIEFVNKVGVFQTAFGVIGSGLALFGKYKIGPWIDDAIEKTGGLGEAAIEMSDNVEKSGKGFLSFKNQAKDGITLTQKLSAVMKGLTGVARSLLKGLLVGVAITALTHLAEKLYNYLDKIKNADKYALEEVESSQQKLAELISEREELASKETLSDAEKERASLLEDEIALQERSLEIDKQRYAQTIADKYSPKTSGQETDPSDNEFNFATTHGVGNNTYVSEQQLDIIDTATNKTSDLTRAYVENQKEIADLTAKGIELSEALKTMTEGDEDYIRTQNEISDITARKNQLEDEAVEIQSKASDSLQELIDQRSELEDAIEGATEANKESLQADLDKVNLNIEYEKALLGVAGANSEVATEQYNALQSYSELEDVYWRLKNGMEVQVEELDVLAQKHPEVAEIVRDYGTVVNGAYVLSEDGMLKLGQTSANVASAIIDNEAAKTASVMQQSQARMEMYRIEADAAAEAARIAGANASSAFSQAKTDFKNLKINSGLQNLGTALGESASKIVNGGVAIAYDKAADFNEKKYEDAKKKYDALQEQLKKAGSNAGTDKTGVTDPTKGTGKPTTDPSKGSGKGKDKKDKKEKIDLYDLYQNKIDAINESLAEYDNALNKTNALLELNQSFEERTPALLEEEMKLYDQLAEQTEAKRKAQNDALWEENFQLDNLKKKLQALTKVDPAKFDFSKMSNAEIDKWAGLNVTGDFADSKTGQEIMQIVKAIATLSEETESLHENLIKTKQELHELGAERIDVQINYQNDILEKLEESRGLTEETLDILDDVLGTEQQRMDLNNSLVESYSVENEILDSMIISNAEAIRKLTDEFEAGELNQQEYISKTQQLGKQQDALHKRELQNLRKQYELRKQNLEIQREQAEKELELSMYGERGQDAWENSRQDEIDRLQDQLDALDDKDDEEDYLKQVEEKEKEIADLQEKLNNLRNQKTIQQLEKQEDGSFQWTYVEDKKAIAETEEDLNKAQEDLQKLHNDKMLNDQKDAIQDKIDAIQSEIDRKRELYEQELQMIQENYEAQMAANDAQYKQEVDLQNKRIEAMKKFGETWDKDTKKAISKTTESSRVGLAELNKVWDTSFNEMSNDISRWVTAIIQEFNRLEDARRQAAEEADSMTGGGGYIPGHANGLRFVEANNMLAYLHYGERVLTRQEASQYNAIEKDIKSGQLQGYFDSLKNDAINTVSTVAMNNIPKSYVPQTTNNTQSTQISIGTIELPQVKDANGFIKQIEAWGRKEFGGLAQKAKIKSAK